MTREKHRRLIARLQAVEEKLPLAQEVEPSDIVCLLYVVAEARKRFAHGLGIVDRLFELLLLGEIIVGVDAGDESDALRGVRCGARSEGKQTESQDGNENAGHCSLPGERRQSVGDSISTLYRLQVEPALNERQGAAQGQRDSSAHRRSRRDRPRHRE